VVIDGQVEPLVRSALDAVVKRDDNRLDAALQAFPDTEAMSAGIELAIAICSFVLFDTYDGRPSTEDIREAAAAVAEMEKWTTITPTEVSAFLTTMLDGKPMETALDPETAVMLTFIVTASLLSSGQKLRDGEWWFNYLDRVEAAIEAAP
jgi:hypothetical protein